MQTRVTAQSQSYQLRQRLQEAGIGHGQEIRADLSGVRVMAPSGAFTGLQHWLRPETAGSGQADIYFCNMGRIGIREVLTQSDGGSLPESVELDGLDVPAPGTYDLADVLIQSNGRIRVVVDSRTRLVTANRGVAAVP